MKIDGCWLMCWNFQDLYLLSALISTGQILIERTALKIRTELEDALNQRDYKVTTYGKSGTTKEFVSRVSSLNLMLRS